MKNKLLIICGLLVILCMGIVSCEKTDVAPTTKIEKALLVDAMAERPVDSTVTPMASWECCSHRHWTESGFWYYCCKCGYLHCAGSGAGPMAFIAGGTVEYMVGDVIVVTMTTDTIGHWDYSDIANGIYDIRFTKEGFVTVTVEEVEMKNGVHLHDMAIAMEKNDE